MDIQYARRVSDVQATANRVKVFLGLGVLGGAALSLLAGLATARRAMEPIAELTATAREVERTRDATVSIPRPVADDEVAELATTFEEMLQSLEKERAETARHAGPPARVRRRRLARAAHPAHVGAREPGAARGDAHRRAQGGRRLRAALEQAHAPAGRRPAAARPPGRRARRRSSTARWTCRRSWPRPPPSSSRSRATTTSRSPPRRAPRSRASRTSCTGSC